MLDKDVCKQAVANGQNRKFGPYRQGNASGIGTKLFYYYCDLSFWFILLFQNIKKDSKKPEPKGNREFYSLAHGSHHVFKVAPPSPAPLPPPVEPPPPLKKGGSFSQQVVEGFKMEEGWSVDLRG